MPDQQQWQRETAIRKFNKIKTAAERAGIAKPDAVIAQEAANYVGATADTVKNWIRGK